MSEKMRRGLDRVLEVGGIMWEKLGEMKRQK